MSSYTPGPTQRAILRAGVDIWFLAVQPRSWQSALRLHDRGYMDRDPKSARRFRTNDAGKRLLKEIDAKFGTKRP